MPNAYCYPFWSYGTAFAYDYGPYAPAYGYGGTGNIYGYAESNRYGRRAERQNQITTDVTQSCSGFAPGVTGFPIDHARSNRQRSLTSDTLSLGPRLLGRAASMPCGEACAISAGSRPDSFSK